jgi:predicted acylesterase/phospholipase RssA
MPGQDRAPLYVSCLALIMSACAHVTNASLCGGKDQAVGASCEYNGRGESSYRFSPKAEKETLVIVTLSGGGARAAALAFGTLTMLDKLDAPDSNGQPASGSLLDQIDIISSVSGGSVTAGWYALKGKSGLATTGVNAQLWDFLNRDWTTNLTWKGLNPWTLARYTFTSYERNDVLSDFFAEHLFGRVTYQAVLQRYKSDPHQPYVILNATDLGHEAIFPFTQGRFDFLCSDLGKYRLADAVAASGNFPLAFSPLGLENYSGCEAQHSASWRSDGPPQWVEHYQLFEAPHAIAPRSIQLNELRVARLAQDYLQSPETGNGDKYVHLLDGGVTDNLGIRSTLAIEDDPARVPSLYLRLSGPKRPAGYQRIQQILYIVVNARTRNPKGIDKGKAPPGEITTALRMVDTQLDSSTLADQDYLIAELEATANNTPGESPVKHSATISGCDAGSPFLSCKPDAQATFPAPPAHLKFYVVSVDFEMIPDKACRDRAWLLATNWGLREHQAQDIVDIATVILNNSADLAKFYRETNQTRPTMLKTRESFDEPCKSLEAHSK